MASQLSFSSSLVTKLHFSYRRIYSPVYYPTGILNFRIHAKLGGSSDAEEKKGGKRKFITKEEEPQQYWQTAGEREGENPMKTPLPYIIIFGMSTPFVILAIAFANGWIKVPIR